MSRRVLILVVPLLFGALPAAAQSRTRTVRYSPFDSSGHAKRSLRLKHFNGGDCWSGSVMGRKDAWRCSLGNGIYDPCFKSPTTNWVVCLYSPWSRKGVALNPSYEDEYANTGTTVHVPWGLTTK